MTSLSRGLLFAGFAWCAPLLATGSGQAPVYNVRLVTDSTPDLSSIDNYLRSITSQYATPQEQAISIWRWSQRLRKQTSNPMEGGHFVLDPITLFNSYGHCNCGIVSGLNNTFWLNMGWKAHYVQLGDHTVCETSWDNGANWHMFDASMSFYCFNDAGQVASVNEISENPRYYLENFAPECGTNPVKGPSDHQGWRCASDSPVNYKRTLANGYDSFKAPNSISGVSLYAQWGREFALNLRPGEHYTRFFHRLDGDSPSPRYYRPLQNGDDVEDQHGHRGIRANGIWRYAPDLRGADAGMQVYDSDNVTWGDPREGFAARQKNAAKPGTVVLRVTAANVITSAKLSLQASRETKHDAVEVEVSTTAGITWTPVGNLTRREIATLLEIDLMPTVAGASEYLVRVSLSGTGAGLESAAIETVTQINRASLPRLSRGSNRVQLTLGPQVETIQFQPSVVGGNHRATVAEEKSIDVEEKTGFYKPTLRPAENNVPAHVIWKIETPTPITAVNYGATVCVRSPKDLVTLLHSWDGVAYHRDFQKKDGSEPFDLMINHEVAHVPAGKQTAFLCYEFATERHAANYAGPGIQTARMTVRHQPRLSGFTPIELTWCWIEHRKGGEVERRHTELVDSPAHEFRINVGGFRDPTMQWVRMNLKGSAPGGEKVVYGYSDRNEIGPGEAPQPALYRWGKNLALGRPYTLTGKPDTKNPDRGGDLTDGIIAPPEEYVSEKYMPTNVIFEKDSEAVATLDLGKIRSVGALRVHAGQEPGFRLAFPETITVEASRDGKQFARVVAVGHDQVFDPPADFAPWEHDDSPKYRDLPAGGRLAFAYRLVLEEPISARFLRVTCQAQGGWGLLLSEIQAFDQVTVRRDVPPPVFLPPLKKGKPLSQDRHELQPFFVAEGHPLPRHDLRTSLGVRGCVLRPACEAVPLRSPKSAHRPSAKL